MKKKGPKGKNKKCGKMFSKSHTTKSFPFGIRKKQAKKGAWEKKKKSRITGRKTMKNKKNQLMRSFLGGSLVQKVREVFKR